MRNAPLLTLLVVPALSFPALTRADDGALTYGGTPHLLSQHPSVRMARERVVVTIKPKGYRVDATFVFRNEGPACSVRMGFPDRGDGGDATVFYEDADEAKSHGKKPKTYEGLEHFRSWVDGRPVKTGLVPESSKDPGPESWHTKRVDFPKGGTRIVRVAYDAGGRGATSDRKNLYIEEASYVLHTGASWKGPIGYAEVVVRFPCGPRPRPVSLRRLGLKFANELKDWHARPKGTVVWSGFAKPTVHGNELRFVRRSFEPMKADDVDVSYGPYKPKD